MRAPTEDMHTSSLIQKVWNFCHTLTDDRVGYSDNLEQRTCLLFVEVAVSPRPGERGQA